MIPLSYSQCVRCQLLAANLVTVRLFGAARAAAKVSQCSIAAVSLGECKQLVVELYPQLEQVLPRCSYLVNEVSQRDDTVALNNGDTVDVLPPFAGG